MPRARNIKPGFFRNADLADCSITGRLLFIGLWTLADREGRLEDRPKYIKFELFPSDNIDIDAELTALEAHGFIQRYAHASGVFIQIHNFIKHQNPHVKEQPSTIPAPDKPGASPVQAEERLGHAGLNPESGNLNPESGNTPLPPDGGGETEDDGTDDEKYPADFSKFWDAYPNKVGKGAALKKWKQVKPSGALVERMLVAIEAQRHGRVWRDGFIVNPTRWLNEQRWNDEVELAPIGSLTVMPGNARGQPAMSASDRIRAKHGIRRPGQDIEDETVIDVIPRAVNQ